jgi:hypothetical protein
LTPASPLTLSPASAVAAPAVLPQQRRRSQVAPLRRWAAGAALVDRRSRRWCASSRFKPVRRGRRRRPRAGLAAARVERENLRTPALRERAAAAQQRGRALRIEIEAGATVDTPAARDCRARSARWAERLINEDPLVRR